MCCKLRTRRLSVISIYTREWPETRVKLLQAFFAHIRGKVTIVETCESRAILFFSAMNLFKKQRLRLLARRLSAVQGALERRRTYPYLKISFLVDRSPPLRFNRTTKLPNDTSITSVFYICICICICTCICICICMYILFTCNCW